MRELKDNKVVAPGDGFLEQGGGWRPGASEGIGDDVAGAVMREGEEDERGRAGELEWDVAGDGLWLRLRCMILVELAREGGMVLVRRLLLASNAMERSMMQLAMEAGTALEKRFSKR